MTWGLFELGMGRPDAYAIFALVTFILTLIGLAVMIFFGKIANKKCYYKDYLNTKISEKVSERQEKELKAKKDAEHCQEILRIEQSQQIRAGAQI